MEPGALPAPAAWSFADAAATETAPIVSDGPAPSLQRVAYGTTDGRFHVRALDTGAEVLAGGVLLSDGAFTSEGTSFSDSGAVAAAGTFLVPHNDGAGVEIARVSAATGQRASGDVALPDSLGCVVAGAPLLTPVAADGTRLLFFTVRGQCGAALVAVAVGPDGELGGSSRSAVAGLAAGVPPALVVVGAPPRFVVVVARTGGIDLRAADGGAAAGGIDLGFTPAALAAPETAGAPTPAVVAAGDRVARLSPAGDGFAVTATAAVAGQALALGGVADPRVAVGGPDGLTVLRGDLTTVGTVPGAVGALSASGDLAYAVRDGRLDAVDLTTLAVTGLGAAAMAPALARGYVVAGPSALLTTDVTPPLAVFPEGARGLSDLAVLAGDDRGIAGVDFTIDKRVVARAAPREGSAFVPGGRYEARFKVRRLPAGRHRLDAAVRDLAGNVAHATRSVRLACRTRRGTPGADRLRGRRGRDCVSAGRGRDRIDVRGGGADTVRCGPGRDLVRADAFDRVLDDCERVRRR